MSVRGIILVLDVHQAATHTTRFQTDCLKKQQETSLYGENVGL